MCDPSIAQSLREWVEPKAATGLLVTDFDRTLYNPRGYISGSDLSALRLAGEAGVIRVVASGRSMYSFTEAANLHLPLDLVVFSSGAGVMAYPSGSIINTRNILPHQAECCFQKLRDFPLDLMIHDPVPENHRFRYIRRCERNDDFERRLRKYASFSSEYGGDGSDLGEVAQFLLIDPSGNGDMFCRIKKALAGEFSVIRATSPMDNVSTWIEVFDAGVSKSSSAAFIHSLIPDVPTLALGNDYNDSDLLAWAQMAYVMADAPSELKAKYNVVPDVDSGGFSKAVSSWLETVHGPSRLPPRLDMQPNSV